MIVVIDEVIELCLLLEHVLAAGLVASFVSVRCMRSCRPLYGGLLGLMRSMPIPKRSHHIERLDRPKKAERLAKGTPLSVRIAMGSPKSLKALSKTVNANISRVY